MGLWGRGQSEVGIAFFIMVQYPITFANMKNPMFGIKAAQRVGQQV